MALTSKNVDLDLDLKLKISNGKKFYYFYQDLIKKGIFELLREFNRINNKDWVLLISSYENNEYLKAKEEFKENKNIIFYGESNFETKKNYIASLISLYYQVILKILVL